jgi:peptidoglycan hydrolase-like protein with peptidoglycan-binding domain
LCKSIQNLINKSNWGRGTTATPNTPPRSFLLMPGYSSPAEIKELQKRIDVDRTGKYDHDTRERIRELQTNYNLRLSDDRLKIKEDGIVGQETGAFLNEKFRLGASDSNYNTGSKEGIIRIQETLRDNNFYMGEPNGRYDSKTAKAIREFQKDYNENLPDDTYKKIKVDGKWGPETKAAFEEVYRETDQSTIATPPPVAAPAPTLPEPPKPVALTPPQLTTNNKSGQIILHSTIGPSCLPKDGTSKFEIYNTGNEPYCYSNTVLIYGEIKTGESVTRAYIDASRGYYIVDNIPRKKYYDGYVYAIFSKGSNYTYTDFFNIEKDRTKKGGFISALFQPGQVLDIGQKEYCTASSIIVDPAKMLGEKYLADCKKDGEILVTKKLRVNEKAFILFTAQK